jgi:hypothetical protein
MRVKAEVTGINLYGKGEGEPKRREVSIEWAEPKTENDPYPIHYRIQFNDTDGDLQLGDTVLVSIERMARVASI